ncbi:hypothetical protein KW787_02300 [Candidatus Pacearchaeota archaeon]|nr:hypothetical protein [Candidatus Pacearchaeota archaeon]
MDLESVVNYDREVRKTDSFSSKYLSWKYVKKELATAAYEVILPMSVGVIGGLYIIKACAAHL